MATTPALERLFARLQAKTKPFVVGRMYERLDGVMVTCITVGENECARFDDNTNARNGWRYDRDHDRGRVTGTDWNNGLRHILPDLADPEPPWPATTINCNNARREGWRAYFANKLREQCPFPPARVDLRVAFEEGWDAASEHNQ